MCFSKHDSSILFDNLERPLVFDNVDQTLWNDKCDYQEIHEIHNLNPKNKNLLVLQLNIRSLLGKQNELNDILNKLCINKSLPKVLLLSETHLDDSKLRHLNILNYLTLSSNRPMKEGGGVVICIHNSLKYKLCKDLNKLYNKTFECTFIELTRKSEKPSITGFLY